MLKEPQITALRRLLKSINDDLPDNAVQQSHARWASGQPATGAIDLILYPAFYAHPTLFGLRQSATSPEEGDKGDNKPEVSEEDF
jgi:hypothetical protein